MDMSSLSLHRVSIKKNSSSYIFSDCPHIQGTVAKKPYNPILGETFKCYWDLPNGRRNSPDENGKVGWTGGLWCKE